MGTIAFVPFEAVKFLVVCRPVKSKSKQKCKELKANFRLRWHGADEYVENVCVCVCICMDGKEGETNELECNGCKTSSDELKVKVPKRATIPIYIFAEQF